MICASPQTFAFYGFASVVEACIGCFVGHFYYKATHPKEPHKQLRWSSVDSRDMWIDAAKSMITAAGIAAALVAALSIEVEKTALSPLVIRSVKFSVVALIVCVCVSMFLILSLSRGHEVARARHTLALSQKGYTGEVGNVPLGDFTLIAILGGAFFALSGFFLGFLFLGRIVWHL